MPPRRVKRQDDQEDAARIVRNAQDDAARIVRNAQDDAARIVRNAHDEGESEQDDESISANEKAALKKDKMYKVGEMSSRLAHDLQNPLSIIKNTLETLRLNQSNVDEKTIENYERIERAVSRMSQIVRQVLDYVRTSDLAMKKTSLIGVLKTISSGLDIPDRIKLILPTEDVNVYGDEKQIETVFANLILNAIQAISGNGRIMIQATETAGETVIDVIDNGQGIKEEYSEKIFEPLFTTKPQGTGLGLVSCKSIVESHGGAIEFSSLANKGTVFTVKFPKF